MPEENENERFQCIRHFLAKPTQHCSLQAGLHLMFAYSKGHLLKAMKRCNT